MYEGNQWNALQGGRNTRWRENMIKDLEEIITISNFVMFSVFLSTCLFTVFVHLLSPLDFDRV